MKFYQTLHYANNFLNLHKTKNVITNFNLIYHYFILLFCIKYGILLQ
jgi:hypothetical protein